LDIVEFFFRFVSLPSKWDTDYSSGDEIRYPVEFDTGKGRYEYTISVNAMFDRFRAPFRLSRGQVHRTTTEHLQQLLDDDLKSEDANLVSLVQRAIGAYKDPRTDRRVEAAECMCKAFEHIKSSQGPDIKSSIANTLAKVPVAPDVRTRLDEHLKGLTNLGHSAVRHSTQDSPSIDDKALSEYLFFTYLVTVRYLIGLGR
jgi:hypothetical protein